MLIYDINTKDTEKISRFFRYELYAWSCVNFKEVSDIDQEIIWNNTKNTFNYCDWVEKGIIFIKHIYD